MVDHPASTAYPTYLTETIHFQAPISTLDPREIASLYVDKRLSSAQIAAQFGCSKSFVLLNLKRLGLLRKKGEAQTDPANYRSTSVPFGHRVVDGKLTTHSAEIKVCRIIIEMIDRQGLNYLKTAQALSQKGIKNRRGGAQWHHYTVSQIYRRWKGKL